MPISANSAIPDRGESCPSEAELQSLVADQAPAWFDEHLTNCACCQQAVEQLAAGIRPPGAPPPNLAAAASSQRLTIAMQSTLHRVLEEPAEGATKLDSSAVTIPPSIGSIEVVEQLGQGGMGVVFRGIDQKLQRSVAIKTLRPDLARDDEIRSRFLREAQAAARIEHPNVVTIHSVVDEADTPYLVMRHVKGESLQDRLSRGRLSPEEAVRVAVDVAEGLAAAHREGVIHRDLKPANILLDAATGQALISDFGLARVQGRPGLTQHGVVAGTPEFMAPEQAAGELIDHRADLFAMGSVLYYALTGVAPFSAENALSALRLVREHHPVPVRALRPEIPEWLNAIVLRLLAKRPEDRFGSAEAVADALQAQATRSIGSYAGQASSSATAKWGRRTAVVTVALAVAGLLLVGLFTWPKRVREDQLPAPSDRLSAANEFSGFSLVGDPSRQFTSLAAAVNAAESGEVIEVFGSEPIISEPTIIRGKRLTLRAAFEGQPRLVFFDNSQPDSPNHQESLAGDSEQASGWRPMIDTDSALSLEGLTFEAPAASQVDLAPEDAIIVARGEQLRVSYCRFEMGPGLVALQINTTSGTVEHTEFRGPAGYAIMWTKQGIAQLNLSQNSFSTRAAVTVTGYRSDSEPAGGTLSLERNSFRGDSMLQLLAEIGPRRRILVDAVGNDFDVDHLCVMLGFARTPRARGTPEARLQTFLNWRRDQGNYYSPDIKFLAVRTNWRVMQMPLARSLDSWLELWQITHSDSQMRNTAEAAGRSGADPETIGPAARPTPGANRLMRRPSQEDRQ